MLKRPMLHRGIARCFATLAVVAVAGVAKADSFVVLNQNSYSYSNGGEFQLDFSNQASLSAFANKEPVSVNNAPGAGPLTQEVFCAETMEEFTPGVHYDGALSQEVKFNNGQFGDPTPQPAQLLAAENLYYQFATGTLPGYDYTNAADRNTDAGGLQFALWTLLGETNLTDTSPVVGGFNFTPSIGILATDYIAAADPTWAAQGGLVGGGQNLVRILNLTAQDANHTAAQDQFMLIGTAQASTPLPTSVAGGIALIGLLGVARKVRFGDYRRVVS